MKRLADNVINKATGQILALSTIKKDRDMILPGYDQKMWVYGESAIYPGGTTGTQAAFGKRPIAIVHDCGGSSEDSNWDEFHRDLMKACIAAKEISAQGIIEALEEQNYTLTNDRKRQLLLGFQPIDFIAVFEKD